MSRWRRIGALFLVAAAAASAYYVLSRLGGGGWIPLKALAVLPLALAGWLARSQGGAPLAAALAVHSCGDVLIETAPLPAAIAAFGLGHLLYARIFARERLSWDEVGGGVRLRLGLLALAGAGVLARVGSSLPAPLELAVPLYALLLLAMAALAQVCRRGNPWVASGALLYVLSDALLALDLFAGPVAWTRWVVWPAYWSGQAAIAAGWLVWNRPQASGVERA